MHSTSHLISVSDTEELWKRFCFLDEYSKVILGAHLYQSTLTDLRRIEQINEEDFLEPYDFDQNPFVFFDELSLNTLFYLVQLLCQDIPMEKAKLYNDVRSSEMLELYQKGMDLLNRVNETKLTAFQIRELDILSILVFMRKYIENQHQELSCREEKLALLEEYFKIYYASRQGKIKKIDVRK